MMMMNNSRWLINNFCVGTRLFNVIANILYVWTFYVMCKTLFWFVGMMIGMSGFDHWRMKIVFVVNRLLWMILLLLLLRIAYLFNNSKKCDMIVSRWWMSEKTKKKRNRMRKRAEENSIECIFSHSVHLFSQRLVDLEVQHYFSLAFSFFSVFSWLSNQTSQYDQWPLNLNN